MSIVYKLMGTVFKKRLLTDVDGAGRSHTSVVSLAMIIKMSFDDMY